MDFFTVPTIRFGVLYCFFVIAHAPTKRVCSAHIHNPSLYRCQPESQAAASTVLLWATLPNSIRTTDSKASSISPWGWLGSSGESESASLSACGVPGLVTADRGGACSSAPLTSRGSEASLRFRRWMAFWRNTGTDIGYQLLLAHFNFGLCPTVFVAVTFLR